MRRGRFGLGAMAAMLLGFGLAAAPAFADPTVDWITGLPREPIHVNAWPGGKKVAVCFIFDVEVWGHAQGPNFRSDNAGRNPDVVNEAFREYAIHWGVPRVARLFKAEGLPVSLAMNAEFPEQEPEVWSQLHSLLPDAPIVAHGLNNSTRLLPLSEGLDAQVAYIKQNLDMLQKYTGQRARGWSSPSVYPNAETFTATAAAGIRYSLDGMDSDVLSRLQTQAGPLVLMPYPPQTVDMGQYLVRFKQAGDMERLWIDYLGELVREAEEDPSREATIVTIGIHPFVVGTPDGAAALRRVLDYLKQQKLVWVTDTEAVMAAIGEKP
jgi:peptidoglycan/xylan/chitin deacetylase (PgdA/CDA1 family)